MTTDRKSRSKRGAAAAALLAIIASVPLLAHRRDEYLQAARIAIDPARVSLELDVTPGIAIAQSVVTAIDRNHDGSISEIEARAFAADVQSGVRLEVDGQPLPVELLDVRAPLPLALTRGEGTVRLTLTAALPALTPGRHHVFFRNDHHPADAAYLANALAPSSARVEIDAQRRDGDQRELTIDYTLDRQQMAGMPWFLIGGLIVELVAIGVLGLFVNQTLAAMRSRRTVSRIRT